MAARQESVSDWMALAKAYDKAEKEQEVTPYVVELTPQNAINLVGGVRRLTPKETARLQTIPDWYRWNVKETQIYKMLGNGWTVEVIKHIFSFIKTKNQ